VKNELLDEAIGSILDRLVDNGLDRDTDIFLTTDHGEFSTSLSWRTIQSKG